MSSILDTLRVSASGLHAQRLRLQTISSNMANARSTSTSETDEPYRRKLPVFKAMEGESFETQFDQSLASVEVVEIDQSDEPFRVVFDPSHPDADDEGYVKYPNVDILYEMVDLMTTSRSYEANTNVVETTYQMANVALELIK
jgi:flagellar basal-body rod protein FlgC